jgi:hypothetical protein
MKMKLGNIISMNPNYAPNIMRRPIWTDVNTMNTIGWVHRGDNLVVLDAENCTPESINSSRLKVLTSDGEVGWVRRGDYKIVRE